MARTLEEPRKHIIDLNGLMGVMTIVIQCVLIMAIIGKIFPELRMRQHRLWIESPTKCTIRSLPLYQALRTVRKHGWHLVNTQPIMTRWQAFKYSIGIWKE